MKLKKFVYNIDESPLNLFILIYFSEYKLIKLEAEANLPFFIPDLKNEPGVASLLFSLSGNFFFILIVFDFWHKLHSKLIDEAINPQVETKILCISKLKIK